MPTYILTGKLTDFGDAAATVTGTIQAGGTIAGQWTRLDRYAAADGNHVADVAVKADAGGNLVRADTGGPVVLEATNGFGYRLTLHLGRRSLVFYFDLTANLNLKDIALASPAPATLGAVYRPVYTINGTHPDNAGNVDVAGGAGGGVSQSYVDTAVANEAAARTAADAGKANTVHAHVIADTTGLQTALDGKAAAAHTHPSTDVSDLTTTGRALLTSASAAAARTTLGLGGAAVLGVGTAAGTVAAGNDSRLSDARTPLAHTHGVNDLTATGTKDATTFLRGDNTWAVPAGGGGVSVAPDAWAPPGLSWYSVVGLQGNNVTLVPGQTSMFPLLVPFSMTWDQLVLGIITAATAGGVVRPGLWKRKNDGTLDLVTDFGAIDSTTTGTKTLTGSWPVAAGAYWMGFTAQVASCVVTGAGATNYGPTWNYGSNYTAATYLSGVRCELSTTAGPLTANVSPSWYGIYAVQFAVRRSA